MKDGRLLVSPTDVFCLKLFVSTSVIQVLRSFMCIGLEGSVENVLEID